MKKYYPAFLNTADKRCIIIGGGQIAERKVDELLRSEAVIAVISPNVSPSIERMAEDGVIDWIKREYRPGDLSGSFLAIAATDNQEINRQVYDEAQHEKSLVNVVDVPPLCDFIAPATIERGPVTIAISTGGASPALARKLRESLEKVNELEWADTAEVVASVRAELKERKIIVDADTWQTALDQQFLRLVVAGDKDAAASHLLDNLLRPGNAF